MSIINSILQIKITIINNLAPGIVSLLKCFKTQSCATCRSKPPFPVNQMYTRPKHAHPELWIGKEQHKNGLRINPTGRKDP